MHFLFAGDIGNIIEIALSIGIFIVDRRRNNPVVKRHGPGAKFGYAVFGKVVSGMDVVKAIEATPTSAKGRMRDVPTKSVTILSVKRK